MKSTAPVCSSIYKLLITDISIFFQVTRHNNLKSYSIQGLVSLGFHHPSAQVAIARVAKDIKQINHLLQLALDKSTNYPMDKANVLMQKYTQIASASPVIPSLINNSGLQPACQASTVSLIVSLSLFINL